MRSMPKTPTELTTFYKSAPSSEILAYLRNNPKQPTTGQHGETALHWAAFRGLHALAEALLARGYEPNQPDKENQRTPLHWATQECKKCKKLHDKAPFEKIIKLLRQHGAAIDTRDHRQKSPLDIAGKKSILRDTLTERPAYFNLEKRYNEELKKVIQKSDGTALKNVPAEDLLAFKDPDYNNALLLAARYADMQTFIDLFNKIGEEKAKILLKQTDYYDRDAVTLAAVANNCDILDVLYSLNQPYTGLNSNADSALTTALKRNNFAAAETLLLTYCIPLRERDKNLLAENAVLRDRLNTREFFLKVVRAHNVSLFTYVLRHITTQSPDTQQAYLSYVNDRGENAVMLAAQYGNKSAALKLVELTNIDLTHCNKEGVPVLAYLVYYDCLDAILHILHTHPDAFTPENREVLLANLEHLTISGSNATQTEKIRQKIANALTHLKYSRAGATSYFSKELIARKPRSYKKERTAQLLRQCATQIFLAAKKEENLKELVEVQIMVLDANLVITVNPARLSTTFSQWFLQYQGDLTPLLSQIHDIPSEYGSKIWSTRHALKLQYSLFNSTTIKLPISDCPEDQKQAYTIANLFKNANLTALPTLDIDDSYQLCAQNQRDLQEFFADPNLKDRILILAVNNTPCPEMHAEEYLKILFQHRQRTKPNLTSIVQGKKRPCLSCAPAIEHIGAANITRPGLFFRSYFNKAPDADARRILQGMLKPQYVTVATINGRQSEFPNFATASESEAETREREAPKTPCRNPHR